MVKKECKNCRFFRDSDNEKTDYEYRFCCRYPQYIKTDIDGWCGEWKKKESEE